MKKENVNAPKFSNAFVRSINDAMYYLYCSFCFSPSKEFSEIIRDCQKQIDDCLDKYFKKDEKDS